MTGETDVSDVYIRLFKTHPCLVEIKAPNITDVALKVLGSLSNRVLSSFISFNSSATDNGLQALCSGCPSLKHLSLDWPLTSSDASVQAIASHCPRMESLSLQGWSSLTDLSLTSLSLMHALRVVDLSWSGSFSSSAVQDLVKSCRNLEELKLSIAKGSVDALFRCIGTYSPQLKVFHFGGGRVTCDSVVALVRGCPLLEELVFDFLCGFGPDDRTLYIIAEACPRLKVLTLDKMTRNTCSDQGMIALSRGCPDLRELHLHNSAITDATILSFAEHNHKLDSIKIIMNDNITRNALVTLFEVNRIITDIELIMCTKVDDVCVLARAQHCHKLKTIYIMDCQTTTEPPLSTLIMCNEHLEDLSINDSTITDNFITLLIHHCKCLRKVQLAVCFNITERGLYTLLEYSKYLTCISVYLCGIEASVQVRERLASRPEYKRVEVTINNEKINA